MRAHMHTCTHTREHSEVDTRWGDLGCARLTTFRLSLITPGAPHSPAQPLTV